MSNLDDDLQPQPEQSPRVLFFGMRCTFSVPPLQALVSAGFDLTAVIIPGTPGSPVIELSATSGSRMIHLPLHGSPPSIDRVIRDNAIPFYSVSSFRNAETIDLVNRLAPDVIVVACFPWLIPDSIRAIPTFGSLNLHPSLLPRWRGPEPLLWTLLSGDRETGVTVHLMDEGFDTGPVLAQRVLPVVDGVDGLDLERELAFAGGELLVETIRAQVIGETKLSIQENSIATFAPFPDKADLLLTTEMPAQTLFNIIRGVASLRSDLRIRIDSSGEEVTVKQALSFDMDGLIESATYRSADVLTIRCHPGLLTIRTR